jgi:hypothetical protein
MSTLHNEGVLQVLDKLALTQGGGGLGSLQSGCLPCPLLGAMLQHIKSIIICRSARSTSALLAVLY